jgi:mannose-6-phosphate isomerase-like protein (cupin superfamily)
MKPVNINSLFKNLKKDPKSDIELLKVIDGNTSLLIAELKPNRTLSAHYHKNGSEIYQVISGNGSMECGKLLNGNLTWEDKFLLTTGDIIEVKENEVHRLSNNGDIPLRLIFITPPSHLENDRIFI